MLHANIESAATDCHQNIAAKSRRRSLSRRWQCYAVWVISCFETAYTQEGTFLVSIIYTFTVVETISFNGLSFLVTH